jgi:hypothetical protein
MQISLCSVWLRKGNPISDFREHVILSSQLGVPANSPVYLKPRRRPRRPAQTPQIPPTSRSAGHSESAAAPRDGLASKIIRSSLPGREQKKRGELWGLHPSMQCRLFGLVRGSGLCRSLCGRYCRSLRCFLSGFYRSFLRALLRSPACSFLCLRPPGLLRCRNARPWLRP